MVLIERRDYIFQIKTIWLSQQIYDVDGCAAVYFHHCRNKLDVAGFVRSPELYTSLIDLTQNLDEIRAKMAKKSCRYAINRAQRDGIEVKINQDYDEFYRIYRAFNRQKGLPSPYPLDTIKQVGTLLVAKLAGQVVGGHVYLEDKDTILHWLGATERLSADRETATIIGNASHLLHWEVIQYAQKRGIKVLDLGGLALRGKDDPRSSIDFFKLSFGGQVVTHYSYRKDYSKLYSLGRHIYHRFRRERLFLVPPSPPDTPPLS